VSDLDHELEGLRAISPQAALQREGGRPWVLLPQTKLQTPAGIEVMDTVLCPEGDGSYVTRLLLERRVARKDNLNWQQVMAIGRPWHTWSWNGVPASQAWLRIFIEHARQLR
jgi:hypothetical protein